MILERILLALSASNLTRATTVDANEGIIEQLEAESSVVAESLEEDHHLTELPMVEQQQDELPQTQQIPETEEATDDSIQGDDQQKLHIYEKNNHYVNDHITIDNTLYPYIESLDITALPRNYLLTSFDFQLSSTKTNISSSVDEELDYTSYKIFPRSLSPILSSTKAKELHLRFTQGKWDNEIWGQIPNHGGNAGGIGVEIWASIEADTKEQAFKRWIKLVNGLSGLFCASLNFIDSTNTITPVRAFNATDENVFLFRAALPSEPVCTENLTPFVKFLPTRGKSGLSSLLNGHRVFESEWHTMSIDVDTKCDGALCHYDLLQKIDSVVDLQRVLRRKNQGSIPKPVRAEDLVCDLSKDPDDFKCFPLDNPSEISFKLSDVFGRKIKGASLISEKSSKVCFKAGESWSSYLEIEGNHFGTNDNCFELTETKDYDMFIITDNTRDTLPVKQSEISVSRSLTGYGQDKGGSRTVFKNKSSSPIRLIYLETLPWFMRTYLHTLKVQGAPASEVVQSIYYKPEIDRERPTHYEFELIIPALSTIAISYQFDKSLLLYAEYPPDANHGFSLEPGVVITVSQNDSIPSYQIRTSPGLLTLPTPDFSMPYNVIILTSTLMAFAFGSIFNLLTKRVMNEEDVEFLNLETGPKSTLKRKVDALKALVKRRDITGQETEATGTTTVSEQLAEGLTESDPTLVQSR